MEIEKSWIPTLLCVVNDAMKYNDGLRNSQTVRDAEEIEDWMLQISQFKDYLQDQLERDPERFEKYRQYLER